MTDADAENKRVIAMLDERGEFGPLEDGYIYYWPQGNGAIGPHTLRLIADELDRRNAAWDAQVQAALSKVAEASLSFEAECICGHTLADHVEHRDVYQKDPHACARCDCDHYEESE